MAVRISDETREELKEAAEHGIAQVVERLRDGKLTHDELEDAIVELTSATIDAAIPTGPLDEFDDGAIRAGVVLVYRAAARLTHRNPASMRQRAARLRRRGRSERADELEQEAAQVAERLLVRSTVGSGG